MTRRLGHRRRLSAPPALRIPLAGLRERLDGASRPTHWDLDINGIPGRSLVAPAGPPVTFPVRLEQPVRLTGLVRLIMEDWRNGNGAVRASIAAELSPSTHRELWSGVVGSSDWPMDLNGLAFDCEVPGATRALHFGVERLSSVPLAVGRVLWVDVALHDPVTPEGRDQLYRSHRPNWSNPPSSPAAAQHSPLFSVLTPVHDPPLPMLEETIASVIGQTFGDWELCLVDDGSRSPEVMETLRRHAAAHAQIRLVRREQGGGISSATNAALEMARGDYVVMLDHDDTLVPDALELIAQRIAGDPSLDMIYSDEAVVDRHQQSLKILKPGWSPERMGVSMYTCHVAVYRRVLAEDLGGFRSTFDGCQDYDFVLRLSERTDRIAHIPQVLYHWRAHASSTAGGDQAKPYAYVAQPQVIAEHLARVGSGNAIVEFGPDAGLHRIIYPTDDTATVAIVLPAGDPAALVAAAATWSAQPHAGWHMVLGGPPSVLERNRAALAAAGFDLGRVTGIAVPAAGGPGVALARATEAALAGIDGRPGADQLLLLQAPMAGLTHGWLARLLGYSAQPAIAGAGPIVLSPDGRIAEAGIALPDGVPLPMLHGRVGAAAPALAVNVSALSGAVTMRAEVVAQLGGLRGETGELALVDLTLRALDAGLRNVLISDVRLALQSEEYVTNDLVGMHQVAGFGTRRDPFYNPHFRTDRADFSPLVRD